MVRALLAEGTSVAILDLKVAPEVLTELQSRTVRQGQRIAFQLVDITDPQAAEAAMDQAAGILRHMPAGGHLVLKV
jgi:NAD(P)-dependent dehydrogenase (short-subunit alcohol dehydrogenase family)